MPKLPVAILIAVCGLFASAAPATADERRPESGDTKAPSGVTLKDATAIVRQAYGGRVLSAVAVERRATTGKPEPGYRLRVDVEGTVKTVFVDHRGRIHATGNTER